MPKLLCWSPPPPLPNTRFRQPFDCCCASPCAAATMSDSCASASADQLALAPSPPRILTLPPGYVQGLVGAGLAFSPVTLLIVSFKILVGTWAD
ncbi:hypothetical protein VF21_10375 [Pseudogymnoascus sp. 05NY08]|nr:hypothetical protein VF21_10375 [Pseudogymnoascus sp. 05NY08]